MRHRERVGARATRSARRPARSLSSPRSTKSFTLRVARGTRALGERVAARTSSCWRGGVAPRPSSPSPHRRQARVFRISRRTQAACRRGSRERPAEANRRCARVLPAAALGAAGVAATTAASSASNSRADASSRMRSAPAPRHAVVGCSGWRAAARAMPRTPFFGKDARTAFRLRAPAPCGACQRGEHAPLRALLPADGRGRRRAAARRCARAARARSWRPPCGWARRADAAIASGRRRPDEDAGEDDGRRG